MYKNRTKRMWNMCLLAFVLSVVLAIGSLLGGTRAQASSALDVADYKGNREKADWTVPTEAGKIFAGWYEDAEFKKVYMGTEGSAYPKFVDEKVLTVKKQLKSDTKNTDATTSIRFLTAIDSLMFKGVTFDVKVPLSNKEWTVTETTAYTSMKVDGEAEPKLPSDTNVFNTADAKYFVAHSFTGIPNAAFGHVFTVTPSWETMDGTIVKGKVLNFTINGELLDGSLFVDKVSIGERTEDSAVQAWDISQIKNNQLTGTNLTDGQVMWFRETGNAAVAQMTVTRNDTSGDGRHSQPLAAIGLSDGTNYGYVGPRAGEIIYNGTWKGLKIGKDVLTTWSSADNLSIELEIVLQNGKFSIYVDELYITSIDVSQVMTDATVDTNFAFSLVMSAFNEGTAELKFSNIRFATGKDAVDNFFLEKAGFASTVSVNGKTVTSALDKWNTTQVKENIVIGTHDVWSFYLEPLYFGQTGSTMLLQTEITNVTETIKGEPVAGLYVTDGTNKGYFGLTGQNIVYGQWADKWKKEVMSYAVLSQWGNKTVKLDVALKNGVFAVYADGIFVTDMTVAETMFTGTTSGNLAFGLTMRMTQNTSGASMKFKVSKFTTDTAAVDAFIASKAAQ